MRKEGQNGKIKITSSVVSRHRGVRISSHGGFRHVRADLNAKLGAEGQDEGIAFSRLEGTKKKRKSLSYLTCKKRRVWGRVSSITGISLRAPDDIDLRGSSGIGGVGGNAHVTFTGGRMRKRGNRGESEGTEKGEEISLRRDLVMNETASPISNTPKHSSSFSTNGG